MLIPHLEAIDLECFKRFDTKLPPKDCFQESSKVFGVTGMFTMTLPLLNSSLLNKLFLVITNYNKLPMVKFIIYLLMVKFADDNNFGFSYQDSISCKLF